MDLPVGWTFLPGGAITVAHECVTCKQVAVRRKYMPNAEVTLGFEGPYSWGGEEGTLSILDHDLAVTKKPGIYLWTILTDDGELIYYVGETGRSFSQRMHEHYKEHAAGAYHLNELTAFRRGDRVTVWEGLYGRGRSAFRQESVRRFCEFAQTIAALTEIYRFYLAPLECDARLRQRIEAAIATHLYRQPGIIGHFQEEGIRYRGRTEQEATIEIAVYSAVRLLGMPPCLLV